MNLAYYITSHGFGHGVRSALIADSFGPTTHLFLRSDLPAAFFHEEIKRPFVLSGAEFDCGCIQTDGITVDIPATIKEYTRIEALNKSRLSEEVAWCKINNIDAIIVDTTPFACEIAHAAGIASFVITNFTWHDIYEPYVSDYPAFSPFVETIKKQYASATELIALAPANPMTYFQKHVDGEIVGRRGFNVRKSLLEHFKCDPDAHVGLIYLGGFGFDRAAWNTLRDFSGWEFFGLYPFFSAPPNYHIIDKAFFPYENLTATADCVIGKIGYSTVAECMCNGTPLIYLPRENFAEYPYLSAGVEAWGGGYCFTEEAFDSLAIGDALDSCVSKPKPKACYTAAEKKIAAHIEATV